MNQPVSEADAELLLHEKFMSAFAASGTGNDSQFLTDQLFHGLWDKGLVPKISNVGSVASFIQIAELLKSQQLENEKLRAQIEAQKNELILHNAARAAWARFNNQPKLQSSKSVEETHRPGV